MTAPPPSGRAWLGWLCVNRLAASMPFMVYAGALDTVRQAWDMSAGEAGSIQTGFNVSYAVSLVVTSSLADRIGAKRVFVWSSCLAAAAAIAFAVLARSYLSGLVLFAAAGLALGGTYTPSIMLVAQGVPATRRGTAVGLLLAAGSLGYVLSIAAARTLAGTVGYAAAFAVCGAAPAVGAVAALLGLRSRPNLVAPPPPRPAQESRANGCRKGGLLGDRRSLLLTLGYTAHCWELLGMWGWMPAFLAAAAAAATAQAGAGAAPHAAAMLGLAIGATLHLSGCAAAFLAGRAADRFGYRRVLIAMGLAGAACSFAIGWAGQAPAALLWPLAALYGFTALGDSPVLSAAMTESVDPGRLGRALAVRSILGFGAGGLAPVAFGLVLDGIGQDAGTTAWGAAFGVLGIGGALATVCAVLLPPEGRRHGRNRQ